MAGTLFLIVGPSGAGKDTLIAGAREALANEPQIVFARRAITRAQDAGGEDHEEIAEREFDRRRDAGGFLLHWEAHGLKYGLPAALADDLAAGRHVVANVSRAVLREAIDRFPSATVVEITASPEVLARRLAGRGRETEAGIADRLAREAAAIPDDAPLVTIVNDGSVADGIAHFVNVLHGDAPPSAPAVERKLGGAELGESDLAAVIADIVGGRYTEAEIARFLVAASTDMSRDEAVALARVRAANAARLDWDADLVADKHSMGGIPGSRITMIVVPIVAAHGMTIPKTSSRAITSAAGTADAMEVLARVDLDVDAVRRVVRETNGCIVWNGRLNHSRVDEVMNAITRPLRIDSLKWSVASILSKKVAAGATHCVIDVPLGPTAKVRRADDARELRELFLHVGEALGLGLDVRLSDGRAPVGRGVGPALEARDVLQVLRNEPEAPPDLRDKALEFAAAVLCFDPAVSRAEAPVRVRELLDSGAAFETFERMIAAQGRAEEAVAVGSEVIEIAAGTAGTVAAIDCFELAGIARTAGAPQDKGAGVDLLVRIGDAVSADTPLYRIHARDRSSLEAAALRTAANHAFTIEPD